MSPLGGIIAVLSSGGAVLPPAAPTLRYAVVIGSNVAPRSRNLEELISAEDDAREVAKKLVECCNFSERRTRLLLRPTRDDVLSAFDELAAVIARDRESFGPNVLLAVFFMGHGLKGELLMSDEALGVADLLAKIQKIGPELSIGVLDACHSGSFDPRSMRGRGAHPAANLLDDVQRQWLPAKGIWWAASAGPDEIAYEDKELGGLFTHYFLEALDDTENGPIVTLDRIGHLAQTKTSAYALSKEAKQTPRIFSDLSSSGPIFFSFPGARTARVDVARSVVGGLMIHHEELQLIEVIELDGNPRSIPLYSGTLHIARVENGRIAEETSLRLGDGETLALGFPEPRAALGLSREWIDTKHRGGASVSYERTHPNAELHFGARYELAAASEHILLPRDRAYAVARYDRGPLVVEAAGGYGQAARDFPAWSYILRAFIGRLGAGIGADAGGARWKLLGTVGAIYGRQTFGDHTVRPALGLLFGGSLSAAHRFDNGLVIELGAGADLVFSESAAVEAPGIWRPAASASVSLLIEP